jgi:galactosylceramidase
VALRDPKTGDWSVIVVTGEKRMLALHIADALKQGPVHVWKSTATEQFVKLTTLETRSQCVKLELEADAIYTLTSTTGQQKGTFGTPPPRLPFPFPFNEGFENYKRGDTARYFSDQKGTFEVAKQPDGRLCLAQVVPAQGIIWMGNKILKPHTLFGDADWKDCSIQADVCLAGGDVEIGGRYADRNKLGYRLILAWDGNWSLNWQLTTLAKGTIPAFKGTEWHQLSLDLKGDQITGWVDGVKLATVTDGSGSKGMAVLASSYDRNLFDNVCVSPLSTVKK